MRDFWYDDKKQISDTGTVEIGAFPTQACQYCASAIVEVDRQPDELAGSRNKFHSFDQSSTDVDLLEVVHRDFGFDWSGNETGQGLCSIESSHPGCYRQRLNIVHRALALCGKVGGKATRRVRAPRALSGDSA